MPKSVVGLDIGQRFARAAELEGYDKARPTVVRTHTVPIDEGAVVNGEVREIQTVASALRRLWKEGGFKSKDVVIGVGNQRVITRDLAVPSASSMQQIREALPFQVQDMLPVPVADALLDFYPLAESDSDHGPVINGILVAAVKEAVLANVRAVQAAGLNPLDVDLIPFALTRAVIRGPLASATVVLIDVGSGTTNVVVSTGGIPQFVRMIPVGGDDITRALVGRMEISVLQAEAFKAQRGLTTEAATSDLDHAGIEVIRTATHELLNSIRNTLQYYVTSRPSQPIQGIVLSGGGAKLPGFARDLSEAMRLQVIGPATDAAVEFGKQTQSASTAEREELAVAIGLAIGRAA